MKYQSSHGASSERATGKPKEEELVARLVVVRDELVALRDIGVESNAEAAEDRFLERQVSGAKTRLIENNLLDESPSIIQAIWSHGTRKLGYVRVQILAVA
jgi:hypothetical protein